MPRTAEQIDTDLTAAYSARAKAMSGQSVELGGRKFTRANIDAIQRIIDIDEGKYLELTGQAYQTVRANIHAGSDT